MRRSFLVGFAACLAAFAVVAAPKKAHAGFFLGAEFDAASAFDQPGASIGYGFVGTLGYRIGLGPIFLQPEAQGSHMVFPVSDGYTDVPTSTRILGGARVGLGRMVQPQLFGHAGVGWVGDGINGRAFDGGFALGFKLIPLLRFGAQIAYNVVTIQNDPRTLDGSSTSLKWLSYGAHAGIEF
ncbi:Hypothetical protein A7982_11932 [Minicystis rosea]|nr:Hypothetical protein A7982_11932 [Minicystis rosea]